MTNPLEIITQSLKKAGVLGVGQTANAEDTNDAFLDLNDMIAQWRRKRWLVWTLVDISKVSTGAVSYTVGAGMDFDVARPDRLEAAFLRQLLGAPNNVDYPLEIIESREIYNDIALKQLASFPSYVYYDSAYPTGVLYPWPVPQADIYEIHLSLKVDLPAFATLVQDVNMPPEYVAALKYNLAIRMRQAYQLPIDRSLVALADEALNVIRGANTQISRLSMPTSLVRHGIYNIYSDTTY